MAAKTSAAMLLLFMKVKNTIGLKIMEPSPKHSKKKFLLSSMKKALLLNAPLKQRPKKKSLKLRSDLLQITLQVKNFLGKEKI